MTISCKMRVVDRWLDEGVGHETQPLDRFSVRGEGCCGRLARSRLRSRLQRSTWTLIRRRTAVWARAAGRIVSPNPTGPMTTALWPA